MNKFGQWLRHKIRVIIIKQWKKPRAIYKNLSYINRKYRNGFNHESIYKVANSRLGWYKRCSMNVVNFILNPKLLSKKCWNINCRAVYETRMYGSMRGR